MSAPLEPQVLKPFSRDEVRSTIQAAAFAGRSVRTVRLWCAQHNIGRRIGSEWAVSVVALDLFLSGEREALAAYLAGDRSDRHIVAAYQRHGVPLPRGNGDVPFAPRVCTMSADT